MIAKIFIKSQTIKGEKKKLKLFQDNPEYLKLIKRRDTVKVELEKFEKEYGTLEQIEEKIGDISKEYKNAKRRFEKVSADKAILEAEGKEVNEDMIKLFDCATEEFLNAKRKFEPLEAQKVQIKKAKQKYEKVEKSILKFFLDREADLLQEKKRLEEESETLGIEFEKKYGHVVGENHKCVLCGNPVAYDRHRIKVHYLNDRYERTLEFEGHGLSDEELEKYDDMTERLMKCIESLGKKKMVMRDTWPKEVAEMYDNIMNVENTLKEVKDLLKELCDAFGHKAVKSVKQYQQLGICVRCGAKEPWGGARVSVFCGDKEYIYF